jgi:hypothetical protein
MQKEELLVVSYVAFLFFIYFIGTKTAEEDAGAPGYFLFY